MQTLIVSFRWETLPDPDSLPPKQEPLLEELFKEIRSTVEEEIHIVQAVFPNPALVMQVFLQRVFAQSVRNLGSVQNQTSESKLLCRFSSIWR